MTPELQSIVERLEKLEKQIAALVTDDPGTGQAVKAQSFVVTDAQGQPRAMLSARGEVPGLLLLHADGKCGVEISIRRYGPTNEGGPCMAFFDANGERRATLEVPPEPNGGPWLGFFDGNGNLRACLVLGGEGPEGPALEFYNAEKKPVACVLADQHGPDIILSDANGNGRVRLRLNAQGPWLEFYDAEGRQRLDASVQDEHGPMIILRDKNTNPSVSVFAMEDGPSVTLHNPNGKEGLNLKISPAGEAHLFMGDIEGPSLKLGVKSEGPFLLFGKDNKVFWSAP